MTLRDALGKLLGRGGLPAGFTGRLDADEHVLASAPLAGGGHLVTTSYGVWVPGREGPRRIAWHLVSRAAWQGGAIVLVEADERESHGRVVLLADRPAVRLRLDEPGRVPAVVHERVTGSIRSRHRRELPGGGAWFVQRKVPGRGTVLQVRPDPGTDDDAVRQVAADVAESLPPESSTPVL